MTVLQQANNTSLKSCWILSTHTHPFNGPFPGTTRVGRYQKGKTNLDFTEAIDSEWQWHQLGHMQVCTSLQTDNHAPTPQQRQSTEGKSLSIYYNFECGLKCTNEQSSCSVPIFTRKPVLESWTQRRCGLQCGLGAIEGRQQIDDDRKQHF